MPALAPLAFVPVHAFLVASSDIDATRLAECSPTFDAPTFDAKDTGLPRVEVSL